MSISCRYEGCAVGETGACALEREPDTCSNRFPADDVLPTADSEDDSADAADNLERIGAPVC